MLSGIGGDLKRSLNKAGITHQVAAVQVCDMWEEVVCGLFGPQVAGKSQALHLKDGVLTVAVLSPVLAQEFRFKESELRAALNGRAPGQVRRLRFEV